MNPFFPIAAACVAACLSFSAFADSPPDVNKPYSIKIGNKSVNVSSGTQKKMDAAGKKVQDATNKAGAQVKSKVNQPSKTCASGNLVGYNNGKPICAPSTAPAKTGASNSSSAAQ